MPLLMDIPGYLHRARHYIRNRTPHTPCPGTHPENVGWHPVESDLRQASEPLPGCLPGARIATAALAHLGTAAAANGAQIHLPGAIDTSRFAKAQFPKLQDT